MSDLDAIKDELSISMNSIVNILDKTEFRPTYYMVQDYFVFLKVYENSKLLPDSTQKFLGICNMPRRDFKYVNKILKKDKSFGLFRCNYAATRKCGNKPVDEVDIGFSWDCSRELIDGYTVTYSAIQLAVWMGVSEIYLLGCDCNYSQKINHVGEYQEENHEYSNKTEARLMKSYECAYNQLKGKVKIYNATRGGQLEVFPRVNFDDLIKENNSKL